MEKLKNEEKPFVVGSVSKATNLARDNVGAGYSGITIIAGTKRELTGSDAMSAAANAAHVHCHCVEDDD
jgi:hypothetical protein